MPVLTYLGHSAFLLQANQGSVVIDPFLTGNPVARLRPADLRVDAVLLTHAHGDHLGDGIEIAKANDAVLIAPFELANYCAAKGAKVHPMHLGGARTFPFGRVKLTIAHHGSAAPDGTYCGNPCGYLLTMDGKTLYHPGDTALFYDMKLIGEMNPIDVALLPIGDNFTMGVEDAVKAAELLRPRTVVPMHYKTFDIIDSDPHEFVRRVTAQGVQGRVVEVGETLEF